MGGNRWAVSLSEAATAEYLALAWAVGIGGYFERPRFGISAHKSGRRITLCHDLPKPSDDMSVEVSQATAPLGLPQKHTPESPDKHRRTWKISSLDTAFIIHMDLAQTIGDRRDLSPSLVFFTLGDLLV